MSVNKYVKITSQLIIFFIYLQFDGMQAQG